MATVAELNASADALTAKVADVKTQVTDVKNSLTAVQSQVAALQAQLAASGTVKETDLDAAKQAIDAAVAELASV